MLKKLFKIITLIILSLSVATIINSNTYAVLEQETTRDVVPIKARTSMFGDIKSQAEGFLSTGKGNQKISAQTAKDKILPLAGMLVGIATVVFLIVGGILGVQYMMNGANERAQLKQKLIWFVIAVVVVYGGAGIFNIAVNIMLKVTGEG